jgi:translation initiation factor eIF-2B subunit beta
MAALCLMSCRSEIILTIGWSKTVESFFKVAANHRKYTVIVAEAGPS